MISKYIERFSTKERVLHWFITVTFFSLLLSGLGLYSRLFTGYFNFFGGGKNAILVHKIAGVCFFISSILFFLHNRSKITEFDDDDKEWIKQGGGYLSKQDVHLAVGKFNVGQKMFAIFIGIATLIMGISGALIWFPLFFPRWLVQPSLMLHGLMFLGTIMFVVVHVYLATIGNPGTLEAMLWGRVSRGWAKHHHPKWYKEVSEEKQ